jgi:hypothetical protein
MPERMPSQFSQGQASTHSISERPFNSQHSPAPAREATAPSLLKSLLDSLHGDRKYGEQSYSIRVTNYYNIFCGRKGGIHYDARKAEEAFKTDPAYAEYAAKSDDEIIKLHRRKELGYDETATDIPAEVQKFIESAVGESHVPPESSLAAKKNFKKLADEAKKALQGNLSSKDAYVTTRYARIMAKRQFKAATNPSPVEQIPQPSSAEEAPVPEQRGLVPSQPQTEVGSKREFSFQETVKKIYERVGELLRSSDARNLTYHGDAQEILRRPDGHTRFIMLRGPKGNNDLSVCVAVNVGRSLGFNLEHAFRGEAKNEQEIVITYFHEAPKGFWGIGKGPGQSFAGSMILGDKHTPYADRGYEDLNTVHVKYAADSGYKDSITERWKRGYSPLLYAEALGDRHDGPPQELEVTSQDYESILYVLTNGQVDSGMMKKVIGEQTGDIFKGKVDEDQSVEAISRLAGGGSSIPLLNAPHQQS